MTLARKIGLLGLANLLLAGVIVFVFGRIHYGLGAESLLVGPARDRFLAIGQSFRLEVANGADPAALLTSYSRRYQSDVFLTNPGGEVLYGPAVTVPGLVLDHMQERGSGGPPPGPDGWRKKKKKGPPREPFFFEVTRNPTTYWSVLRIPIETAEGGIPAMLIFRSNSLLNSELFFNWRPWLGLGLGLAGITLLCWWPFLQGLTRTVAQMDRATKQMAQGRFDARVAEQRSDELGDLGAQINRMAQRLEDFVRSQKRFLGDTAHELSAPIARVQFALGILEQRVEGERSVATLRDEVQEMSELVSELLSFSKVGMEPGATQREPLVLADLVRRAVAREGVPAAVSVDDSIRVLANDRYLSRAVANLVRNAQRYAGGSGIGVRATRDGDRVALVVEDEGPGLPADALEQIFEPFYRPHSSRSRETGGVGLGLAIVKSCVEASGGTVSCRNRSPRGLEVRILLDTSAA